MSCVFLPEMVKTGEIDSVCAIWSMRMLSGAMQVPLSMFCFMPL